ncbi:MAG: hypothetical protein AB1473_00470 [Thermodesulfobacteriota bacterium]
MSNRVYKSDMSIYERVMMALVRVAERFKKNSAAVVSLLGFTSSEAQVGIIFGEDYVFFRGNQYISNL